MRRALAIAGLAIVGLGLTAEIALADPPCGRGWRWGEYCGPRHHDRRDWDRRDAYRRDAYRGDGYQRDGYRDGPRYGYAGPRGYAPPPPQAYAPNFGPTFSLNIR